jgi:hypothetical protein
VLRLLSAKVVAAALVGLAAGAGGGFALADAVGGSISGPAEKGAALDRLASVATTDSNTEPAPVPDSAPRPIPARMLEADVPVPVAPSILRVRNGWLVSDGKTLVAVYAGAAGDRCRLDRRAHDQRRSAWPGGRELGPDGKPSPAGRGRRIAHARPG